MRLWRVKKGIKSYLITDYNLYPRDKKEFYFFYRSILDSHEVDFACYRDKNYAYNPRLLETFLELNLQYKIKSFINSNYTLALEFGFDGLHCNSSQIDLIKQAKSNNLLVFFSGHNEHEVIDSGLKGADAVTISPVFHSPNKGEPLGVEILRQIVLNNQNVNIIALGGITNSAHIEAISHIPLFAFASIRYFLQ